MPTNRTRIKRLPNRPPAPWERGESAPPRPPRCPSHLSKEARVWWRKLCAAYDLTPPPAQLLLTVALEALDRMRAAQSAIREAGLVQTADDKLKTHPAATVERDSRSQLIQALRALNLAHEVAPIRDIPGRPSSATPQPKPPDSGPSRFFR